MKLDYAALISPYPLFLPGIGNVKSPRLSEIWDSHVTYPVYTMYLSLLLMTPQTYCKQPGISESEMPQSMFDIIAADEALQKSYVDMFNFFFMEHVVWDNARQMFLTYDNKEQADEAITPVGAIQKTIFSELCDVILQRCAVFRSDTAADTSKTKSKRALEIVKKLQKGRQAVSRNTKPDKDMELPNLITAVAVKSNSINFTNIWDLTVFQLFEQFKKEQTNVFFDIQKMSVAAYGNEKNKFKGNEWYKTEL